VLLGTNGGVWVSDRWDVEDLANVGSTPVCEKLFCDGPGGLEQPYFRKLFENREYIILETMDMADYALSADISDSGSEGATSDMAECALSTDISDSGSDGATSCSSPFSLPKSKKYLLYKIQSGEGFNLQRNVAMRVAHMMMGLEEAHKYTLVLPPFTNAIH
jgi:hypothetical protein